MSSVARTACSGTTRGVTPTAAEGVWLVTGASGFLGLHVLDELSRRAHAPRVMALLRSAPPVGAPEHAALSRLECVRGSVADADAWLGDPRLKEVTGILHLAALVRHSRADAAEVERTHVEGMRSVLRLAAQQRCRVVALSTSGTVACFESPDAVGYEDAPYCDAVVADWPYYASKLRAERAGRALAEELGVDLVIVRPPVLLGPHDHRLRSTTHVARILSGELPFAVQGGFAFVDVRDAAAAIVRALAHASPERVYHLPGANWTLPQLFERVGELAGCPTPGTVLPGSVARGLALALRGARRLGMKAHSLPDPVLVEMGCHYWSVGSHHAERDLGHRPRDPLATLRDTIQWLLEVRPELVRRTER